MNLMIMRASKILQEIYLSCSITDEVKGFGRLWVLNSNHLHFLKSYSARKQEKYAFLQAYLD